MTPELVAVIADRAAQGLDEGLIRSLRAEYPSVHFTYCADDDIHAGRPVAERPGVRVYLVDGREHCLCLTSDMDTATGLVLADVMDDGD